MGLVLDLEPEDDVGLWPEHLPAWRAWCAISGQWKTEAISGWGQAKLIWLGLDYSAARAGLEMAGIAITPDLWDEVRAIETGAIEGMNRER